VSEHLNAQGRPDPRGGFPCFWCPLGVSDPIEVFKNGLEMKKLCPPKVEGVKN